MPAKRKQFQKIFGPITNRSRKKSSDVIKQKKAAIAENDVVF